MGKIPELQNETLMLHYYRGLKVKEIADLLNVNDQVIKNRLFQGRKSLKNILQEIQDKHGIRLGGLLLFPSISSMYKNALETKGVKYHDGKSISNTIPEKSNILTKKLVNPITSAIKVIFMTSVLAGIVGGIIISIQQNDNTDIGIVENDISEAVIIPIEENNKSDNDKGTIILNAENIGDSDSALEDNHSTDEEPTEDTIVYTAFQPSLSIEDKVIPRHIVGGLLDKLDLLNEDEYNIILSIPGLLEVETGEISIGEKLYSLNVGGLKLYILTIKTISNNYIVYSSIIDSAKLDYSSLNLDVDDDMIADLNIDNNGDGLADLNIDLNFDGLPDLNIDLNKDKIADLNIDLNTDKIAEINIDTDGDWLPDLNVDSDGDRIPDYNIDQNSDGKPDYLLKV